MASTLTNLDPAHAWSPYSPDAKQPWNHTRAAHLFRRAAFAANTAQLDEAVKAGPAATLDALFAAAAGSASADDDAFRTQMDALGRTMMAGNDPRRLSAYWLYRMLNTPAPLLEKTALFWHGHFATGAEKVRETRMVIDQNNMLRAGALGSFEKLVQAISRDPAMLVYLDSTTNRRIRPNENYARELMELFCLGPGHYTEKDIQEIARAFTGWEVRADRFTFNKYQHDTGIKTFLGQSGNYDGDDAVRIVLDQPAAPRFIARKLVRYFVCEEPELPGALIEPLAVQLRENGFVIGPVIKRMLASNLFFGEHAIGRKVRSPVELGVGLLAALEGTTDLFFLAQSLDKLGQAVFYPPNVKGWDGGRTWINSSTLLGRANLVRELSIGGKGRFGDGGLASVAAKHGVEGDEATVDWLLRLLVAVDVPGDVRRTLLDVASSASGGGGADARIGRVVHAIATLPEFQLC